MEPPNLWVDRLPSKYASEGPHVVRERGFVAADGSWRWQPDPNGSWADVWYYDDVVKPLAKGFVAVGLDRTDLETVGIYDDLRPGTYLQAERLVDMDTNHTEASVCFPNLLPRFCGQTFMERSDKALALLCVRAYNDWIVDDWCAGDGYGRLIPLIIVPLWDPHLAADEVRRCAAKGAYAVTFSENPWALGLPSIHSGAWDVFFAACEEVDSTVCIHIGSSSVFPTTSPDAPRIVGSVLLGHNAAGSLLDLVFSGTLARFPALRVCFSEANVGWMPYVIQRMDQIWEQRQGTVFGSDLPRPPSSYLRDRVYGCMIDDVAGVLLRDDVYGQICFETDYPHSDSQWPDSKLAAERMIKAGNMNDDEVDAFLRGNAIKAFGLHRFGVT
ncbi:MAG: amidohydrolase family protein [Acidimicrobiia bacterium]